MLVEVFDEWGAMAQHVDEANMISELKERVLMRQRQKMYRKNLEEQQKEADLFMQKYERLDEEKEALERHLSLLRKEEDKDLMEVQKKRDEIKSLMDENIKQKDRMIEQIQTTKYQENLDELNTLKRLEEQRRMNDEMKRKDRQKTTNDLRQSYAIQEARKKYENERNKELDKFYNEQYRQKIIEDDAHRQKVYKNNSQFFDYLASKNLRNEAITKLESFFKENPKEAQKKEEAYRLQAMKEQIRLAEEQEKNEYNARLQVHILIRPRLLTLLTNTQRNKFQKEIKD